MSDDLGLSPKRRKIDQELDRISYLPEPLIDKILSLLPILDAVRTSVLSSSWRFKWTTLSNLVFDDRVVVTDESSKLVKIIDNVLLLHSGPVEWFVLNHRQYQPTRDIDLWIRYLSKASMRVFILALWKGPMYKVPSSLFFCQDLTELHLWNCSVTLPPTFRGFKNLKTLTLSDGSMSKQVLENFISGSRLLEKLTLGCYHVIKNLILDVPKLRYLVVCGSIEGISFKHTCCSPSFVMKFKFNTVGYVNLPEIFAPLRNINELTLDDDALKFLSLKEVPPVLTEPLLLLKNLFISNVDFKNAKQILAILCLLRSSPNLNQFKFLARKMTVFERQQGRAKDSGGIELHDSPSIVEMGEIYDSPFTLAHLNSASLTGIGGSVLEMGFIGILLSSSPALQKMTIKADEESRLCPSGSGEHKLLKNMMRLQCPSAQAKLVFL